MRISIYSHTFSFSKIKNGDRRKFGQKYGNLIGLIGSSWVSREKGVKAFMVIRFFQED
jgi:hypothetical protein